MSRFLPIIRQLHTGSASFAGHSKWANIRHIKAEKDGQKSVMFAKFSRQIRLAMQEGKSPNPALNSQLKSVIDIAVKNSMPMANIQNVIKKHSSQSIELKQLVLEMKLLNKIYVLATVYTDNTVLSRQQIATTLRKNNAVYADCKKVFEETAVVEAIAPPGIDQADFLETCTDHAIECGAEDVDVVDETSRRVVFTSHPQSIYHLAKRLGELGYNVDGTDSMFIPKTTVVASEADRKAFETFRDKLKAHDGLEAVFDNMEPLAEEMQ